MNPNFLDFEQPIAELEAKIQELRHASHGQAMNIDEEISRLKDKCRAKTEQIFAHLSPWQIAQLARHPQRPHAVDYLPLLFEDFQELAGDRAYAEDAAIIGGMGRLSGRPVLVLAQEKGRDTRGKVKRNFGMPRPEGYRKARRLMQMAERFRLPVISLIDTPGAYPGVGAEERGQSEAIAGNLALMARLLTPIVCTVIGEGGSGGALAIGVGDRNLMLQYAIYSVISPEGCASILWKSAERAREAAEALGITSSRLKELGLIDEIVAEPLGGAHRDLHATAEALKAAIGRHLEELSGLEAAALVDKRYQRLRNYGSHKG